MASRVQVTLVDDLDGESEAVETVLFGLDGTTYEIDLSAEHAAELREFLTPFAGAARRAGRGGKASVVPGPRRGRAGKSGPDPKAVRAWARENGIEVTDRGRMAADVIAQYEAANA